MSTDSYNPRPLTTIEGKVWRQTYDHIVNDGEGTKALFELPRGKTNNVVSEKSDTNRAVQAQKMVRGLKFWI